MAFKRRKRRFNGRRRPTTKRFFKRVRRIAKRTIINMSEIKRVVVNGTITSNEVWNFVEITPAIVQGVDRDQRIGNKLQYKFLTLDIFVNTQCPTDIALTYPIRIVLLTSRGILTANSDFLEDGAPGTPSFPWIWVPLKHENCNIIRDKKLLMSFSPTVTIPAAYKGVPNVRRVKLSVKMPRNALYPTTAITRPLRSQSRIYLFIASFGGNAGLQTNFYYNGMLSYIDI